MSTIDVCGTGGDGKNTFNISTLSAVYGLDGYDEVSLTDDVKVKTAFSETILTPQSFGKQPLTQNQIFGGDTVEEAATIFLNVLENKGTAEILSAYNKKRLPIGSLCG